MFVNIHDLLVSMLVGFIAMACFLSAYAVLNCLLIIFEKIVGHNVEDYFPDWDEEKP